VNGYVPARGINPGHSEIQSPIGGSQINHTRQLSDNSTMQRMPAYSLDLLSDAAHHLASDQYNSEPLRSMIAAGSMRTVESPGRGRVPPYNDILDQDTSMKDSLPVMDQQSSQVEDYNLFLDDAGLNFFSAFDANIPASFWSRPSMDGSQYNDSRYSNQDSSDERVSFSRYGSRLPSVQPEQRDDVHRASEEGRGPPWRITAKDHRVIQWKLESFSSVLPRGFSLPLRRTISRYIEGYISGFHEHMPFIHIPTFDPVSCAPELILAIAAVGAQYRFEPHRGNRLWYAAKAVALEQTRRRSSQEVLDSNSPASNRPETPGQTPQPRRSLGSVDTQTITDMAGISAGRASM
jgi:hypothetical protein